MEETKINADFLANPALNKDLMKESMPGNIRKADHFLSFMRRIVVYLKDKLSSREVSVRTPLLFLHELNHEIHCDEKALGFVHDRLITLLNTLEIIDVGEY